MDIGAALVADGQAAKAVEPSDRALDDPSADAELRGSAPSEDGGNSARPEPIAVRLGIVAAVAL